METLPQMMSRNARLIGDRVFARYEGEELTFSQLDQQARQLATLLSQHGIKKGDPVGLFFPNGLGFIKTYWACQALGAIAVPMSPMLRPPEIAHIAKQTAMKLAIVDNELRDVADQTIQTGNLELTVVSAGNGAQNDILERAKSLAPFAGEVEIGLKDVANLFFTSGTTGVPKGAMQTHFAQYSALRDTMAFNRWRYGQEVAYCALSLSANLACTTMMNLCMFAGGTVIVDKRWETRRALDAIKQYRVTFMVGPPTVYIYMVNEFDPKKDDITSLRLCIAGGAPVPAEIITRFEALSKGRVSQGYGATEVMTYVTADPLVGERRIGSCGLPIGSASITILDDNGNELPAGELGEVCVDGDSVGSGYWGDPEQSARTFSPKGWLSGDLGRIDETGYLYIVDRKKDLIISGGYNIYPIEVENLLYKMKGVNLCALVGLPDPQKGEIAVAMIVPDAAADLTAESVIAFCRENVAAYKVPRKVVFMDQLPLSPAGKILKRELRKSLQSGG